MSDLISRQAALDAINEICERCGEGKKYNGVMCGACNLDGVADIVEDLPSAQPDTKAQLPGEGTTSDLISRQDAIDVLGVFTQADALGHTPKQIVEALPSAQPNRNTGWWLIREGISDAQCSECKMYFRDVYDMDNSDAFCRHCGAKMEGLKVVEDE